MAQENVGINIQVDGNQEQALGSLKKQLKEAINNVQELSDKFGATSKEAVEAAKRAAELKDEIGDARSLIDAFNPDAKFKALTASLSGVAGGFAAVQGAIGLMGVESKDVEETLLKVQSAMAISEGLQSIGESIDSFKQLGTVINNSTIFLKANEIANKAAAFTMKLFGVSVETTSTSFKVLKGAIAATGIGLLVVALGEVVSMFQNFSSAAENAAEKQKQLNDSIVKGAKTSLKAEQEFLSNQEKIDIAKAKSRGASEKEIFEIEQNARRNKAKAQQRYWQETKSADVEGASAAATEVEKINTEAQVAQLEFQAKQLEANKAAAKKKAEEDKAKRDKQIAEEKQLTEDMLKAQQERRALLAQDNLVSQEQVDKDKKDAEEKAKADKEKEDSARIEGQMKVLSTTTNFALQGIQVQQEAANKQAEIDKIATENKLKELELQKAGAMAALDAVAGLIDQNSVAGKAIAVAKAIMSTYEGATKALGTYPPPFGQIAAAATIAAGLINVKKIISTNIPSAKGSGDVGGGASAPSISASAPISPQQPQAATTNLSTQTINAIGNQAIRSYVVESDVTGNQQRIAAIQQRARFG